MTEKRYVDGRIQGHVRNLLREGSDILRTHYAKDLSYFFTRDDWYTLETLDTILANHRARMTEGLIYYWNKTASKIDERLAIELRTMKNGVPYVYTKRDRQGHASLSHVQRVSSFRPKKVKKLDLSEKTKPRTSFQSVPRDQHSPIYDRVTVGEEHDDDIPF